MGKIKNTESLLNHGDRESRKKITELLERMWAKVDAYHLIKELMSVDGNRLTIGTKRWDMAMARSEERRVGKECLLGCRSRWSPYH